MARKKTKKKRKRRQKDRSRSQTRLSPKMRQNIKELGIEEPIVVRSSSSEKMSEILLDFAEPLMEQVDRSDERAFGNVISIAAFAWNVSLLPKEKWESSIEDMVKELAQSDDDVAMMKSIVQMLIQRRMEFFSDITRYIFDYEILDEKEGWHLNVVSSLV